MGSDIASGSKWEQPVPYGRESYWQGLVELLADGRYEEVAARLRPPLAADNLVLASSLRAVRHLCLTCRQYRREQKRYKQASARAEEREEELRQQIISILAQIDTKKNVETDEPPSAVPVESQSLWQRVRRLFARGPEAPHSGEIVEKGGDVPAQRSSPEIADGVEAPPEPATTKGESATTAQERARPVYRRIEPDRHLSEERWRRPPAAAPEAPTAPAGPAPKTPEPSAQDTIFPSEDTAPTFGKAAPDQPSLVVYCLGPFQVYLDEEPIEEWPSGKGKSILKYLVTHRERPVAKEILMELFWPDVDPDAARNSLNVAIYGMRQALRAVDSDFSHVLFEDDRYLLNPRLHVWVDVKAFEGHFAAAQKLEQRGEEALAVTHYRAAELLYRGEFLAEDRYEEWLLPWRQRLQDAYLYLLNHLGDYWLAHEDYASCIALCEKILAVDPCWEDAHYRLMLCYNSQGQRYLALRQYHQCVNALAEELGDVQPRVALQELYRKLRRK